MNMPPSATLPSVTVTLNDLSLALNEMGLTGSVSAAELFHRLQATQDFTIPSNWMALNPTPDIVVIHADTLGAALANLNVTDVTATQLLDAIKKEESNHPGIPARNTLLELKSPPQILDGSLPPHKSTVIMKSVDREEKARRLEQRDHFRKYFPGGMITNPYHATWLKQFDITEMKAPPFIPSSVPDATNPLQSSTYDTDK